VSPENLDAAWPLTVPWVEVSCLWHYGDQKQAMVYVTAPDDQSYAVNGTAQAFLDMPKIDLIWADSGIAGVKVNIEPLTNVGLLLCK